MSPPDPAIVSQGISSFLQISQERAYAAKITSFQETVKSLQADNVRLRDHHDQEMSSLKAIVKSLEAATQKSEADNASLQNHHTQEISSLQTIVKTLQGSTKKADADIAKIQDHHNTADDSLQRVANSVQVFAKKAEADNNQLQDEIAELRAQLGHTEDLYAEGAAARADRPRQSAMQPQEPSHHRSSQSRFVRNTDEQQLLPRREKKANLHFPPLNDHSRNRAPEPSRLLAQQSGRGIKRAHVDDTAELPHRPIAAEESGNDHGFEQPRSQKTHQTKRPDHKRVHDEMPGREGSRQSKMEDRSKARHGAFVAYYHSKRKEHKNANLGKDQSAFIRGFIDGIKDPDYLFWFQGALKERFPKSVQDATLKKNLTWEDVKTVVKDIPIPYFPD